MLDADDPDMLDARANLASAYWNADLIDDAVAAEERILEEVERMNGPDDLDTLQARAAVASSYRGGAQGRRRGAAGSRHRRQRAAARPDHPGDEGRDQDSRAEPGAAPHLTVTRVRGATAGAAEGLQVAGDGDDAEQASVVVDDGDAACVRQQGEVTPVVAVAPGDTVGPCSATSIAGRAGSSSPARCSGVSDPT